MKLIFCPDCQDLFKLQRTERRCECGASGGRYLDEIRAEISGKAVAVGILNQSFVAALRGSENKTLGENFTAFIFGESAFVEGRIIKK